MTWQLGSLMLAVAASAAGLAWYERTRPSSRILALVATLAALAVVGRLAFAALPNVKPTTDIVIISGYALGGAPGFAVGAIAALASNFVFGQGPWTPWEMLAWGLCGVGGAGLARITGGRIGRWPLAIFCALAGLAFGVLMDLSSVLTYGGGDIGRRFAVYSGGSLPFNIAHAAGNLVFALAFGPGLLQALARFRRRLEVRWHPGTSTVAGVLALALGLAAVAPQPVHAATSAEYVAGAQNSDGGFGATPGGDSAQLYTGWAALGLAATGRNPLDVTAGGRSPIDFTREHAGELTDTGEIERTMLVLGAAGVSAHDFAGRDLVARLLHRQRRDGSWSRQSNWTAFAILALRAAGEPRGGAAIRRARTFLMHQENRDRGYGFGVRGVASDVDDTAAVIQALMAAGSRRSKTVRRAVVYLVGSQNADGGMPQARGATSNAQSTAWAVQGLVAAGRDPDRVRRRGHSPLAYLRALQRANGSVRYSRGSSQTPVWVTSQALAALARKPFPIAAVSRAGGGGPTGTPAAATRAQARARRAAAHRHAHRAAGAPRPPSAAVSVPTIRHAARLLGAATCLLLAPAA